MRLDGLSGTPNVDLGQTKTSRPVNTTDTTTTDSSAAAAATETYQSTGGFDSLLKELQTIPFIRNEAVANAASKLAGGDLDGPEAVDKVVQAIMQTVT